MNRTSWALMSIFSDLIIAFSIYLITNSTKIAGVSLLTSLLNIFGIPILFITRLPVWVIYVIVLGWCLDLISWNKEVDKDEQQN